MPKRQSPLPITYMARTPEQQAERDLRDDMDRLDGSVPVGELSYITMKRPSGGTVYLSGRPYLLTSYPDRAYIVGEHTAHELIVKHPLVLMDAVVVPRGR